MKVARTRVNYIENPVGLGVAPRFSWEIQSSGRNVRQQAYELQIAEDEAFQNLLLIQQEDKEESVHIPVKGLSLESLKKYYYRVRVTDQEGQVSGFSETGTFTTAMIGPCSWKGEFISAEQPEDAGDSKGTYVRKGIRLSGRIKQAYVCCTALGLYQLFINGVRIGRDELTPGWTSYHKHLMYQTYEVTEALQEGENCLGAMLGAGWYKGLMGFLGLRNNYGTQAAFFLELHVVYEDGKKETFVTGEDWQGADAPVLFAEIYDGEVYDARREILGWNEPNKNKSGQDSLWHPVSRVEFDKSVLTAQYGCKVAEITEIPAKRIFTTPQGEKVIDFGQNLTGWVHLKVRGSAGERAILNCFEVLDKEGNVYLDNLRGAKETICYYCKGQGEEEYHPHFTFMGFQYAKVASWPGELKLEDVTAYAVHSEMEQTGFFQCSNPSLNQLWHNILWSMKGNFLDVPTDCPQRNERVGWTGDAQIFCRTSAYLMNTYLFFEKWLADVAADQTKEGGVPHVVPDIITPGTKKKKDWLLSQGTHSAAVWGDVAVLNPWNLYLTFGDTRILTDQYESMKAWIDFMHSHADGVIWNYRLQFGDWVALDAEEGSYFGATPNELTCTAYYALSARTFARIAEILGKQEEPGYFKTLYQGHANEYQKLYEKIKRGFQQTFFDEAGRLTAQTQTAHIIALYFDLTPEKYREQTVQGLLKLLDKENGHLVTGFVGTPYFTHALSRNGHLKEAYELLLKEDFPSWLYQVKQGATTIWEHWDGKKPDGSMWSADMNSFNHYAYGAIGEWMYRAVAGIEIDEEYPGYKRSVIYPRPGGGLTWANGSYHSLYGEISCKWQVQGEQVRVQVTVPANTRALIRLDEAKRVIEADGLEFIPKKNYFQAETGSGSYELVYER